LLDARLSEWGAHLSDQRYEEALAFLVSKCWELSGLDEYGDRRVVWWAELHGENGDDGRRLGPFDSRDLAAAAAVDQQPAGKARLTSSWPSGAYDPDLGLSFSTYSRRILSSRVVDWYRQTYGDARYSNRRRDVSLDQPATGDEDAFDRPDPLATDALDEVLTRVALDRVVVGHVQVHGEHHGWQP
jgi:hypothetical protein